MYKFYTVQDLAEMFSRHKRTIRYWIEEGVFPNAFCIKDGWYVPEKDVQDIISRKCDLAPPSSPPPGLEKRPVIKRTKGFVNRWK